VSPYLAGPYLAFLDTSFSLASETGQATTALAPPRRAQFKDAVRSRILLSASEWKILKLSLQINTGKPSPHSRSHRSL